LSSNEEKFNFGSQFISNSNIKTRSKARFPNIDFFDNTTKYIDKMPKSKEIIESDDDVSSDEAVS